MVAFIATIGNGFGPVPRRWPSGSKASGVFWRGRWQLERQWTGGGSRIVSCVVAVGSNIWQRRLES
ncbi:hypothetical protein F3Y22_tig00003725pilonHSYRG00150 [Hibiscus syriacus]|uniref:Uncharacterized protein n=1 Tax=Hibiscus syriacus TaxID=106335 RepID=A0A6A3CQ36_HIBSY|nr:hypothetical protein F3Y22_tig00003725pilonHSYRG00150 [Hibiscus syriacus]